MSGNAAPVSRRLLSRKQVAEYTGHSPRSVDRWVESEKLIPVRLSRSPRFIVSEVDRFIESMRQQHQAVA